MVSIVDIVYYNHYKNKYEILFLLNLRPDFKMLDPTLYTEH